jgi:hypothetical protein
MKRIVYFALPMAFLMSCGDKKAEGEVVKLDTFKDKLSYALGAEHSKMVIESGDPNLAKLNFDKIVEGFEEGLKNPTAFGEECKNTIKKLYGPYGQDFDTTYLQAGCVCIGKTVGSVFTDGWKKKGALDKIDLAMVKIGFKQGLIKADTLLDFQLRSKIVNDFVIDLNRKNGSKMMASAKKLPNVQVLPNGMIIQTLQAGTGGSPTSADDVKADYILTSAQGDTLESSFQYKKQAGKEIPAFNLAGVIQGWTQGFPYLKKGGKYRLFIPGELAYGEQKGFESLCFYIEFHDFGKAGTLVKPQPQQPQQGM